MSAVRNWCDILAKIALVIFVISLWYRGLSLYSYPLLILAWFLDGGPRRFTQIIKDPFVMAILVFCGVLALGILWGNFTEIGQYRWLRYFILLTFIPFLSLLTRERLSWAIGALLTGYGALVLFGAYHTMVVGVHRLPMPFEMSYLRFSMMLGVGVIMMLYLGGISKNKKITSLLWLIAVGLLFVQFHQDARGALLATVITVTFLIFTLYRTQVKKLVAVIASFSVVVLILTFTSGTFQERLADIQRDINHLQQENYASSVGYRLAMWDVGLHSILQQPLFGQGTGQAASYFEEAVATYKGGLYKDLPDMNETSHYHNDWIEIGVHLGVPGILLFAFFLYYWFKTLREHQLPILGAAILFYIVLSSLTNTMLFSKVSTLLLVITAVAIAWQKEYGILRASLQETELPSSFVPLRPLTAKMSRHTG